ncbi:hypothetical protein [Demequina sp. SO4-18]|uniref:hypothetical protein n=1 Tax=Demequina sp. SO4-18 TaxID=3401026 RepID=UPI003B59402C
MRARAVLAFAALVLLTGCAATGDEDTTSTSPTAESSPTASAEPSHAGPTAGPTSGDVDDSDGPGSDDDAAGSPGSAADDDAPTIDGAVVVHDGGDAEVTVTAEGADDALAQLDVTLSEGGQWAQHPARLGPVVSSSGGTESVTLRLRYPESVADGLSADELILAVDDDVSGTVEFLVLEHDAEAGLFTADHTVKPGAAPEFVLLDVEVYQLLS